MLDNKLSFGKYMAVSPCFRDEIENTEIHKQYFIKVELINILPNNDNANFLIKEICNETFGFFKSYLDCELIKTDQGFDIQTTDTKIELGSYGIRNYKNLVWIYGTGVAEPRLSYCLSKIPKGYHNNTIFKGKLGYLSKIKEELEELEDAINQKNKILTLIELSDLYGSIEGFLQNNYPNITMIDIANMTNLTKRSVINKKR